MIKRTHVWIEGPVQRDDTVTVPMIVEGPEHNRTRIWYQLPARYEPALTKSGDPFVLAMIFTVMRIPSDLHIHGEVSPSLLRNLEEFQSAWRCWRPERYTAVEITADVERERSSASSPQKALSLFSGGVDSCFTVFSHRTRQGNGRGYELQAGLMVHGFDIFLDQGDAFARAAARAKKMLDSLGVDFIPMVTNIRDLNEPWWDFHGAAPASCLMLLQEGFSGGIIPSTEPYNGLVLPWGSNPVTDWMMSNDSFQIIHHGASLTRTEKVREIAQWPEAKQYLRVCMIGKKDEVDRNCGVCQKCVRTILNFRVVGAGLPGCFEKDATDEQIARLRVMDPLQLAELQRILTFAKSASVSAPWVDALEVCILQSRLRIASKRSIKQLRKMLTHAGALIKYASGRYKATQAAAC